MNTKLKKYVMLTLAGMSGISAIAIFGVAMQKFLELKDFTVLIWGMVWIFILMLMAYLLCAKSTDKVESDKDVDSKKVEVDVKKEETPETKTETAPAPAAAEASANPSGLDEVVLSKTKDYFGEEYIKSIESQKARVLKEVNAGFNKGLKDAVDEYETVCGQKLNAFAVNFKTKTSKGGDKDVN